MAIYNINYIDFYLMDAECIGSGTTAKCYKTLDNRVLKIFKHNKYAKQIIKKPLLNDKFDNFRNMSNYTFITPSDLILDEKDKDVIGYVYPYVYGDTLSKLDSKTKLLDLFKNYKQVLSDINQISDKKLQLANINGGNIIYDSRNSYFHIIDLDNSIYTEELSNMALRLYNDKIVLRSIINNLFKKDINMDITFKDSSINKAYQDSFYYSNPDGIDKFIDEVRFYCNEVNPTVSKVRECVKVKTNKSKSII